jgi:hypothetical protein
MEYSFALRGPDDSNHFEHILPQAQIEHSSINGTSFYLAFERWASTKRLFPEWEVLKINPQNLTHFFGLKKWLSKYHIHHAIHHEITTKNHVPDAHFLQNTQQKHHSSPAKKIGNLDSAVSPCQWAFSEAQMTSLPQRSYRPNVLGARKLE